MTGPILTGSKRERAKATEGKRQAAVKRKRAQEEAKRQDIPMMERMGAGAARALKKNPIIRLIGWRNYRRMFFIIMSFMLGMLIINGIVFLFTM